MRAVSERPDVYESLNSKFDLANYVHPALPARPRLAVHTKTKAKVKSVDVNDT